MQNYHIHNGRYLHLELNDRSRIHLPSITHCSARLALFSFKIP